MGRSRRPQLHDWQLHQPRFR